MNKHNFDKRDIIRKHKKDIIGKYGNNTPMKDIAKIYGVTTGCISNNLKLWGVRKKHGLKHVLRKILAI